MFAIYYKAFFRLTTRVRVCRLHSTPHFENAIQACLFASGNCFDPTHLLAKRLVKGLHRLVHEERLRRWVYSPKADVSTMEAFYSGGFELEIVLFCIPPAQPEFRHHSFKVLQGF